MNITGHITLLQWKHYPWGKAHARQDTPGRKPFKNRIKTRLADISIVKSGGKSVTGSLTNSNLEILRGVIEDKIMLYSQAVHINQYDAEAHFKLGYFHLFLKNNHLALEEYKILKDLFPSMADELLRKWNIKTPFQHEKQERKLFFR